MRRVACGVRCAGCGLRVVGCGLRVAGCGLRTGKCPEAEHVTGHADDELVEDGGHEKGDDKRRLMAGMHAWR